MNLGAVAAAQTCGRLKSERIGIGGGIGNVKFSGFRGRETADGLTCGQVDTLELVEVWEMVDSGAVVTVLIHIDSYPSACAKTGVS